MELVRRKKCLSHGVLENVWVAAGSARFLPLQWHAKSKQGRGRWQQQFHQLLVEIYTGFSGGFNARDLQDAKAMLAELACGLVGRLLGGLAARQVTILPDSIRMQSSHRQRPALHPL